MNYKRFIPITIIVLLLVGMVVYGQSRLTPDPLKTQIPDPANSLDQIDRFKLSIRLTDDQEIEMDYEVEADEKYALVRRASSDGNVTRVEDEEAIDQIRSVVANIPSLSNGESLAQIQSILEQEGIAQTKLRSIDFEYNLTGGVNKMIQFQQEEEQPEEEAPTTQITVPPEQPEPEQSQEQSEEENMVEKTEVPQNEEEEATGTNRENNDDLENENENDDNNNDD